MNFFLQYSQAAELNSEATLNCNGKDFKCVNSTHYQPCSLVERNGQPAQYFKNDEVLQCSPGNPCNDENTVNCAVQRQSVQAAASPVAPSQIPVKVTVESDAPVVVAADAERSDVVSNVAAPAKSLPVEEEEVKESKVAEAAPAKEEANPAKEQPSSAPVVDASAPSEAVGKGNFQMFVIIINDRNQNNFRFFKI